MNTFKLPQATDIANWLVPLIKTIDETQHSRKPKWKNNTTTTVHQRFSMSLFSDDELGSWDIGQRWDAVDRLVDRAVARLTESVLSRLGESWMASDLKGVLGRPIYARPYLNTPAMIDALSSIMEVERVVPVVCDAMFLYRKDYKRKLASYGQTHVTYREQVVLGFFRFSDPTYKTAYLITR